MSYEFNPEKFGYEHISKFPELKKYFGNTTYIKVVEIGGIDFNRVVYWYSYCYKIGSDIDQRWNIGSSSYNETEVRDFNSTITYQGLITNENFAGELLCHIMGALKNESVLTYGKKRVERNINKNRLNPLFKDE